MDPLHIVGGIVGFLVLIIANQIIRALQDEGYLPGQALMEAGSDR